ncbi:MAG: PilW family protein [Pseudomonadota bacterium]
MTPHTKTRITPHHQQGVTLVELMVAMVLGLVVIGVVLSNYLTSGIGKNSSNALQQMTEDATVALSVIRKHISTAGYRAPVGQGGADGFAYNVDPAFQKIRGCDTTFTNPDVATTADLTCPVIAAGAADTPDSIAVDYEADAQNSVMTAGAAPQPRDCVGAGIPPRVGLNGNFFIASARLYVAGEELRCQGNGQAALPAAGAALSGNPQPLVGNIHNLRILYGVRRVVTGTPDSFLFLPAAQVAAADWPNVVAVRVCVEVKSADAVLSEATSYFGCGAADDPNATATTPTSPIQPAATDRHMYRAFSTTIMLHNH